MRNAELRMENQAFCILHSSVCIEDGGSPRCCPVLCGLRDRCIAAMLATRRNAKAELNRRSQACDVLTGTGIRVAENSGRDSFHPCPLPLRRSGTMCKASLA